jgi:transposase-like protein
MRVFPADGYAAQRPLGRQVIDLQGAIGGVADQVTLHGHDKRQRHRQRYRCMACQARFNDLTDTIFTGHHQPLRMWILCLYFMGLNLSNQQIASELDLNVGDV